MFAVIIAAIVAFTVAYGCVYGSEFFNRQQSVSAFDGAFIVITTILGDSFMSYGKLHTASAAGAHIELRH